jgi:predicted nucleic acid-binding protein
MRLLLDANIVLDCLVVEKNGQPRPGKAASDQLLDLCDQGAHTGLIAWHTLPIVSYYYGRQYDQAKTATMMDALLAFLEVPTVGHSTATAWRSTGIIDFEDALQVTSALAGRADVLITRNVADFTTTLIKIMTPEEFVAAYP